MFFKKSYDFLKSEIFLCVIIAYSGHYFFESIEIPRIFSTIYKVAYEAGKYAAEILVTCIRKKAAAIGNHSNK